MMGAALHGAAILTTEEETGTLVSEEIDQATKALYGKPEIPTAQGNFLTGGGGLINAGEEQQREGLYRDMGEGDAPSSYNDALGSFFSQREQRARYEQDEIQLDELTKARQGANEVLTAFDVGGAGAKELFRIVGDYMDSPRSEDQIEAGAQKAETELKKAFGHDYQKMTNAARHVLKEAGKRIPGLTEMVNNTGLGNDVDFIKRLAAIGKRRGFAK